MTPVNLIIGGTARGSRVLPDGRVLVRIGGHECPITRELYEDLPQAVPWDEFVESLASPPPSHQTKEEMTMQQIDLHLEGDGAFTDYLGRGTVHHVPNAALRIAVLEGGMISGEPSLAVGCTLEDGSAVILQTSVAAFLAAAAVIRGHQERLRAEGDSAT